MDAGHTADETLAAAAQARAEHLERTVHGCSQCVLGGVMEALGCTDPGAFRAASGLGGGIGLTTDGSCGALTGGVMAIGLVYGRTLERIEERTLTAYRLARRLQDRFVAEYGSGTCKDIHQRLFGRTYRLTDPDDWKAFLAAGGHSTHCPAVVGKAARWTCEILLEERRRRPGS